MGWTADPRTCRLGTTKPAKLHRTRHRFAATVYYTLRRTALHSRVWFCVDHTASPTCPADWADTATPGFFLLVRHHGFQPFVSATYWTGCAVSPYYATLPLFRSPGTDIYTNACFFRINGRVLSHAALRAGRFFKKNIARMLFYLPVLRCRIRATCLPDMLHRAMDGLMDLAYTCSYRVGRPCTLRTTLVTHTQPHPLPSRH